LHWATKGSSANGRRVAHSGQQPPACHQYVGKADMSYSGLCLSDVQLPLQVPRPSGT